MALTRMQYLQSVQSSTLLTAVKAGTNVTISADGTVTIPLQSGFGSRLDAGAVMVFAQAAPPVGWTRITTASANQAMIRIVSSSGGGSGGSVAFTTIFNASSSFATSTTFTSGQVANAVVNTTQLGAHTHGINAINARNQKCVGGSTSTRVDPPGNFSTTSTGGNGGHSHSIIGQPATGNFVADFNVKYVDSLIASFDG